MDPSHSYSDNKFEISSDEAIVNADQQVTCISEISQGAAPRNRSHNPQPDVEQQQQSFCSQVIDYYKSGRKREDDSSNFKSKLHNAEEISPSLVGTLDANEKRGGSCSLTDQTIDLQTLGIDLDLSFDCEDSKPWADVALNFHIPLMPEGISLETKEQSESTEKTGESRIRSSVDVGLVYMDQFPTVRKKWVKPPLIDHASVSEEAFGKYMSNYEMPENDKNVTYKPHTFDNHGIGSCTSFNTCIQLQDVQSNIQQQQSKSASDLDCADVPSSTGSILSKSPLKDFPIVSPLAFNLCSKVEIVPKECEEQASSHHNQLKHENLGSSNTEKVMDRGDPACKKMLCAGHHVLKSSRPTLGDFPLDCISKESKSTVDAGSDTSGPRVSSPSSITSNKRCLEWDSGADVGYHYEPPERSNQHLPNAMEQLKKGRDCTELANNLQTSLFPNSAEHAITKTQFTSHVLEKSEEHPKTKEKVHNDKPLTQDVGLTCKPKLVTEVVSLHHGERENQGHPSSKEKIHSDKPLTQDVGLTCKPKLVTEVVSLHHGERENQGLPSSARVKLNLKSIMGKQIPCDIQVSPVASLIQVSVMTENLKDDQISMLAYTNNITPLAHSTPFDSDSRTRIQVSHLPRSCNTNVSNSNKIESNSYSCENEYLQVKQLIQDKKVGVQNEIIEKNELNFKNPVSGDLPHMEDISKFIKDIQRKANEHQTVLDICSKKISSQKVVPNTFPRTGKSGSLHQDHVQLGVSGNEIDRRQTRSDCKCQQECSGTLEKQTNVETSCLVPVSPTISMQSSEHHSSYSSSSSDNAQSVNVANGLETIGSTGSFEYLPGHVYENNTNIEHQFEELNKQRKNDYSLWGNSDSLQEDLKRGAHLCQGDVLSTKDVIYRIVNTHYAEDQEEEENKSVSLQEELFKFSQSNNTNGTDLVQHNKLTQTDLLSSNFDVESDTSTDIDQQSCNERHAPLLTDIGLGEAQQDHYGKLYKHSVQSSSSTVMSSPGYNTLTSRSSSFHGSRDWRKPTTWSEQQFELMANKVGTLKPKLADNCQEQLGVINDKINYLSNLKMILERQHKLRDNLKDTKNHHKILKVMNVNMRQKSNKSHKKHTLSRDVSEQCQTTPNCMSLHQELGESKNQNVSTQIPSYSTSSSTPNCMLLHQELGESKNQNVSTQIPSYSTSSSTPNCMSLHQESDEEQSTKNQDVSTQIPSCSTFNSTTHQSNHMCSKAVPTGRLTNKHKVVNVGRHTSAKFDITKHSSSLSNVEIRDKRNVSIQTSKDANKTNKRSNDGIESKLLCCCQCKKHLSSIKDKVNIEHAKRAICKYLDACKCSCHVPTCKYCPCSMNDNPKMSKSCLKESRRKCDATTLASFRHESFPSTTSTATSVCSNLHSIDDETFKQSSDPSSANTLDYFPHARRDTSRDEAKTFRKNTSTHARRDTSRDEAKTFRRNTSTPIVNKNVQTTDSIFQVPILQPWWVALDKHMVRSAHCPCCGSWSEKNSSKNNAGKMQRYSDAVSTCCNCQKDKRKCICSSAKMTGSYAVNAIPSSAESSKAGVDSVFQPVGNMLDKVFASEVLTPRSASGECKNGDSLGSAKHPGKSADKIVFRKPSSSQVEKPVEILNGDDSFKTTVCRSPKGKNLIVNIPSKQKQETHEPVPKLTLQECLNLRRPDYIEMAECRRKLLSELSNLRHLRHESRQKLLALSSQPGSVVDSKVLESANSMLPPPPLAVKRVFNQRIMRKQTEKKYRKCAEVVNKKVDKKRKEDYRTNRLMAEIFTKKLQKKVLEGNVNLSNSISVISNM